jgi:hypothetical protein
MAAEGSAAGPEIALRETVREEAVETEEAEAAPVCMVEVAEAGATDPSIAETTTAVVRQEVVIAPTEVAIGGTPRVVGTETADGTADGTADVAVTVETLLGAGARDWV